MFASLWRRYQLWRAQTRTTRRQPARPKRTLLRLEALEDRLTPATDFIVSFNASGSIMTLTKDVPGNAALVIGAAGAPVAGFFSQFTVATSSGTLTTPVGIVTAYNTPAIAGIKIVLNGGSDVLLVDGTPNNLVVDLPQGLTITGTGGDKQITLRSVDMRGSGGNLVMNLQGTGNENATFTDVNVGGNATFTHGTGQTNLLINTTTSNNQLNSNPYNSWNNLSINNGAGADINTIQDTNFAGNVTINNGSGSGGSTAQFAGSHNLFQDKNNTGLMTVSGNLTVTTGSGQSDTEVYDYNVHRVLTVDAGSGISGQGSPSFIGIANAQTNSGTIPTFGSVSLKGTAVKSAGLMVDIGAGMGGGGDFPATIGNGITGTLTGSGAVTLFLNDLTVTGSSNITLGGSTSNDTVTVRGDNALSTYGPLTINGNGTTNNTFNFQNTPGILNVIGALNVNLGGAADTVNVGSSQGQITVSGTLGVTGTGGNKTIRVTGATQAQQSANATLGSVNFNLSGSGTETTQFLDTNVTGAATVSHQGTGDTNFTIDTTTNNTNELNNWNSLSITNGSGSDLNNIFDTIFAGNVTISNGAGHSGSTLQNGGSSTEIHAHNYKVALLNILGNLSVTTGSGQSTTEVYDYNVHGNLTLNSGTGISGMVNANKIGFEDNQTTNLPGIPVVGGDVTITGSTVSSSLLMLQVLVGSDGASGDFPVTFDGNLTVNVNGSGGSTLTFQDVTAENGTTLFTFGGSTGTASKGGNILNVLGNSITSVYNVFNVTSNAPAGANNFFDLQNAKGTLQILSTMNWKLGNANTLLNFASDSNNNNGGFNNATLELFGFSSNPVGNPAIRFTDTNLFAADINYGFKNGTGNTLYYYGMPALYPIQFPFFSPNIVLA